MHFVADGRVALVLLRLFDGPFGERVFHLLDDVLDDDGGELSGFTVHESPHRLLDAMLLLRCRSDSVFESHDPVIEIDVLLVLDLLEHFSDVHCGSLCLRHGQDSCIDGLSG